MGDMIIQQSSMETEYKKTGILPEDIAALRSWVQSQPHLPEISDLYLIMAYDSCDRNMELTKSRIDNHITIRTHFTKLFNNLAVDENVINALKAFVFYLPEKVVYNKPPILYVSLIDYRVRSFNFIVMSRSAIMLLDLMQYEYGCASEVIILLDCTGGTLGHLPKVDLQVFQEGLGYIKSGLLGKIHSVHVLNTPSFASKVLRIVRPIIPDELMKLVTFHEIGSRAIEEVVPVEHLPVEAGGRYKTLKQISSEAIEKMIANKDFFSRHNNMKVNETYRRGKYTTIDRYGSTRGTFKVLDID